MSEDDLSTDYDYGPDGLGRWIVTAAIFNGIIYGACLALSYFPNSFVALAAGALLGSVVLTPVAVLVSRIAGAQLLAMSMYVPPQAVGGALHKRRIDSFAVMLLIIATLLGVIACFLNWPRSS